MTLKSRLTQLAMAAGLLASVPLVSAATIDVVSLDAVGPGGPVRASASFLFGNGTIDITLNNLLWNPANVAQLLSGLWFEIDNVSNPSGTLASSSGNEVNVSSKDGQVGATGVPTGWRLSSQNGGLFLNVLGTPAGPSHLIIGRSSDGSYDGAYSAANGSINNNKAHNPFLQSGATFQITGVTGVTGSSTISNASFAFGSAPGGIVIPCTDCGGGGGGGGGDEVPEPVSFVLIGAGLLGIAVLRRRS